MRAAGRILWVVLVLAMVGCEKEGPNPYAPKKPVEAKVDPEQAKRDAQMLDSLFPRSADAMWELEEKVGEDIHRLETTCLGEKAAGDEKIVFFTTKREGELILTEGYSIKPDGIFRMSGGVDSGNAIDPPMPMLKAPLKQGAAWSWKGRIIESGVPTDAEATFTVIGQESLKLGADTYSAWRVDQTITISPGVQQVVVRNTQWFAPNVGLVKQETHDGDAVTTVSLLRFSSRVSKEIGAKQ